MLRIVFVFLFFCFSLTGYSQMDCDKFLKSYHNTDSLTSVADMVTTAENDVILAGSINTLLESDLDNGYIMRIDQAGNKLWEITLTGPGQQACMGIIKLSDNNFLTWGYDAKISCVFLIKLDISGKIIWRKDIRDGLNRANFGSIKMAEDTDGSIILVGYYSDVTSAGMFFSKFNLSGNAIYTNFFKTSTIFNGLVNKDIVLKDGYAYIAGSSYVDINVSRVLCGFLTRVELSTGKHLWTKFYSFNGGSEVFLRLFNYNSQHLAVLGQDTNNGSELNNIMICDTSGAVVKTSFFQYGSIRQYGDATIDSNGNLLYGNWYGVPGSLDLALCLVNPYTGIQWIKHYPLLSPFPRLIKVLISGAGDIYTTGQNFFRRSYVFVGRHSGLGELSCSSQPINATFGPATMTSGNSIITLQPRTLVTENGISLPSTDSIKEGSPVCGGCTTLKIVGQDDPCKETDTLNLLVVKDKSCAVTPQIIYDTAALALLDSSNGQLRFRRNKSSPTIITAQITTLCDTLTATFAVAPKNYSAKPDLGPDTTICISNKVLLNAHSGFLKYSWQDGSHDSTFQVTKPGVYHVETSDKCGNVFTDSVTISAAAPIPLDLGKDLEKCNSDTLTLRAPSGFLNYSWSPAYNTQSISGQSINVFPGKDTLYRLVAEKTPGCFAYDSIRVKVKTSPTISLQNDTSICAGEKVTLDAGSGFASYIWSNGLTSQSITISSAGTYSVRGITNENCMSTDAFTLRDVWPNPVVDLGSDSVLCRNAVIIPGRFAVYLWEDGSTFSSHQVTSTGLYYVTVQDNNKCKASDTLHVTSLHKVPSNFLPVDSAICKEDYIIIPTLKNFNKYQWSNGATTPSISVDKPGAYSLEVIDENGCNGADTVVIKLKKCFEGFNMPSAFSPDKDGHNDILKPVIGENVNNYQLTIFNRWGQPVFRSTNPAQGWDGKMNGKLQDPGVFVWICLYELKGESARIDRGTVILVR